VILTEGGSLRVIRLRRYIKERRVRKRRPTWSILSGALHRTHHKLLSHDNDLIGCRHIGASLTVKIVQKGHNAARVDLIHDLCGATVGGCHVDVADALLDPWDVERGHGKLAETQPQ
jgi:hypothetical protein